MSLITEDGTGLSTAQSYISVAEADAYFLARGNAAWAAGSVSSKEAAMVRATAALDGIYSARWPGDRCSTSQALDWPRYDAIDARGYEIDSASVPIAVKNATCEAALIELASAGALSAALERGGAVQSEKVGSLSTSYFSGAPAGTVYPAIRQALARILPAGNTMRRG